MKLHQKDAAIYKRTEQKKKMKLQKKSKDAAVYVIQQ